MFKELSPCHVRKPIQTSDFQWSPGSRRLVFGRSTWSPPENPSSVGAKRPPWSFCTCHASRMQETTPSIWIISRPSQTSGRPQSACEEFRLWHRRPCNWIYWICRCISYIGYIATIGYMFCTNWRSNYIFNLGSIVIYWLSIENQISHPAASPNVPHQYVWKF